MFGLGIKELLIIALIILLIIGLTKLPSLIKNIIQSIRIVRDAFKGGDTNIKK